MSSIVATFINESRVGQSTDNQLLIYRVLWLHTHCAYTHFFAGHIRRFRTRVLGFRHHFARKSDTVASVPASLPRHGSERHWSGSIESFPSHMYTLPSNSSNRLQTQFSASCSCHLIVPRYMQLIGLGCFISNDRRLVSIRRLLGQSFIRCSSA